jgi:hypothetical protein
MPEGTFSADIAASRARVRKKMKEGPTGSYGMDILAEGAEHADNLADLRGS